MVRIERALARECPAEVDRRIPRGARCIQGIDRRIQAGAYHLPVKQRTRPAAHDETRGLAASPVDQGIPSFGSMQTETPDRTRQAGRSGGP